MNVLVRRGSVALSLMALVVLFVLDSQTPRVNLGPIAAVPLFFLAFRFPAVGAYGLAVVCAMAFAYADADFGFGNGEPFRIAASAVALLFAYAVVVWSSRRWFWHARSIEQLRTELVDSTERENVDCVTEIYNRRYFEDALAERLAEEPRREFTVIFADLNDFKDVNDAFGHLGGDAVLREVARRFAEFVGKRGIVARIGGDEFGFLFDTCSERTLTKIVGDLALAMCDPHVVGGTSVQVAASFGYACHPRDGRTRAAILATADREMYVHKRRSKQTPTAVAEPAPSDALADFVPENDAHDALFEGALDGVARRV